MIAKNDDVVFSFAAKLLQWDYHNQTVRFIRAETRPGVIHSYIPSIYNDFDAYLNERNFDAHEVRMTFSARVVMPVHKDGEMIALLCESRHGRRFTVRFSDYVDLVFTSIVDEVERRSA